jgi:hypothetical protein
LNSEKTPSAFFVAESLRLEWIDPKRFHAGADWFRKHGDKA